MFPNRGFHPLAPTIIPYGLFYSNSGGCRPLHPCSCALYVVIQGAAAPCTPRYVLFFPSKIFHLLALVEYFSR